jgi:hypothetical protein
VLAEDKKGVIWGIEICSKESLLCVSKRTVVLDQQGKKPGRVRSFVVPTSSAGANETIKGATVRNDHGVNVRAERGSQWIRDRTILCVAYRWYERNEEESDEEESRECFHDEYL